MTSNGISTRSMKSLAPPTFTIILVVIIVAVIIFALEVPSFIVSYVGFLLRSKPEDAGGWCYYGRLLAGRGRLVESAEALQKAVELKPDYAEAWKRLGDVLVTMGQPDAAAEAYRHVDLGDSGMQA
jgi:tetratricopeptide (TPR) repeat protein